MATIHPSLFKLLGAGFLTDRYAADGIHLRWMFDTRLGFPRTAVCLYRRPALGSREGDASVQWHGHKWSKFEATTELVTAGLRVRRASGATFDGQGGIALGSEPLLLEFSAFSSDGAACYARVRVRVLDPGGSAVALAQYVQRDEAEPVDRASVTFGRVQLPLKPNVRLPLSPRGEILKPQGIAGLLERPKLGQMPPKLATAAQKEVYSQLLAIDAARYRTVSTAWLDEIAEVLKTEKVSLGDLVKGGVFRETELVVRADRIDRIELTGGQARVVGVEWVTAAEYVASEGWRSVVCVPAAAGDGDYIKRNNKAFGQQDPESLAKRRVLETMPRGAEPLDEPVFPPVRPPTEQERVCRYLEPWRATLAPWFTAVLDESQGGVQHMSQVTRTIPITDLGQRPGEPLPEVGAGSTMVVRPYNMLLAAATAFPVAQLLGLAYIDTADVKRASAGEDPGTWDYLAIGRWDRADVAAWAKKLMVDLAAAQQRAASASPADVVAAQAELMEALLAIVSAIGELNALLAAAGDGLVLHGLKLGLRLAPAADFVAPASVTPTFEETSVVEPGRGLVRLDWPLRRRARAMLHEAVPVGACIARGKDGAPFEHVLNPVMPELGECHDVRAAILPAGPPGAAGTPGTASYIDRAADEGVKYHYGVSEMDPFGRWSDFAGAPFLWEDRAPPPAPPAIHASLENVDTGLRLRVIFHWDRVRLPPAGFAFHVGLRRDTALPGGHVWPDDAALQTFWTRLSRTLAGSAASFRFLGNTASGTTTTHDGLHVRVSFVDTDVDDGAGGSAPRRIYTVDFTGALEVTRDAFLRARVYAGVASEKLAYAVLSDEVAGPAVAEHIDPAVPGPTALPPEPLLASYADAEGFSTFKLTWSGLADTRYQVLRAAERELVAALPASDPRVVAWKAATTVAGRAAQLRAMAPAARRVFAPVSEWLPDVAMSGKPGVGKLPTPPSIAPGPRTHVDRLPGRVDTLFVYAVLGRSASGEPSPWPASASGFAAVRVPVAAPPTQPVVLRGTWQPPMDPPPALAIEGQARAELTVLRPQSGEPGAYEIYRAANAADAADERRMRRIHIAAPVWEDGGDGPDVARLVDPTVQPWREYWYSVVARSGTVAAPGMRSSASRPVRIETAAPAAPSAPAWTVPFPSISAAAPGDTVAATVTVDFPTAQLDRFRVELWRTHTSPHTAVPVTITPAGPTTLTVSAQVADLVAGSTIVLRVRDPLGRTGESTALAVS